MIVSNKPALILGVASSVVAFAISAAAGWVTLEKGKPSPHEDYLALLLGGLFAAADLAWRLRKVRTLNLPDPPAIFTRDGPVATKPQPLTRALNMLLSANDGAQFFWIVPGWVAGLITVWMALR